MPQPRLRPPLQWDPQRRELAQALQLTHPGGAGAPSTYFCPPLPTATAPGGDGASGDNATPNLLYRLDVHVGRLELALASSTASVTNDATTSLVVVVEDGGAATTTAAADRQPSPHQPRHDLEHELVARFHEHRRLFLRAKQQEADQKHQRLEQQLLRSQDALLAARERLLACSAAVAGDIAAFRVRQAAATAETTTSAPLNTKNSVLVHGCTSNARRAALAEAALALDRAERRGGALRRRLENPRRRAATELLQSAERLAESQRKLDERDAAALSSPPPRLRVAFRVAASRGDNNPVVATEDDTTAAADASLYGRNLLTRRQLDLALEAADMEALAGDEDEEAKAQPQPSSSSSDNRHHRFVPRRVEVSCRSHALRANALANRLAELRRRAAAVVGPDAVDAAAAAADAEARLLALGPAPTRAVPVTDGRRRRALFAAAAARLSSRPAEEPPPLVEASLFLGCGGGASEPSSSCSTYHARVLINGRVVGCTRELPVVVGGEGEGGGGGLRPLPSLEWGEVFSVRLARWPESARLELWERRRRLVAEEEEESASSSAWRRRRRPLQEDSLTTTTSSSSLLLATADLDVPSSDEVITDSPYDWLGEGGDGARAGSVRVRCAWAAERWREGDDEEPPFSCFTNPLASGADDEAAAVATPAQPSAALVPPPRPPCWRPARRSLQPLAPPPPPRRSARSPASSSSSSFFVPPSRLVQLLNAAAINPRDPSDRPLVDLAILREVLGPEGGGRRRRWQGQQAGNRAKAGALELLLPFEAPKSSSPSRVDSARRRWQTLGPFLPCTPSARAAAAGVGPSTAPPPAAFELWRQQPPAAEAWALRTSRRDGGQQQQAVRDPWASVPWWRPLSVGWGALAAALLEPLRPLRGGSGRVARM